MSGGPAIAVDLAESYSTLEELVQASDLIVVGKVTEQHPFPDVDIVATASMIGVSQVLKGSLKAEVLRLYSMGTPVYLPQHGDIDGAGDPPLFDREYIMFLRPVSELTNAAGELVPLPTSTWRAAQMGQYVRGEDSVFHWDGDGAGPSETATIDDVSHLVNGS